MIRSERFLNEIYMMTDNVGKTWINKRPWTLISMFFLTPEKFFGIRIVFHFLTNFISRKWTQFFETNYRNIRTLTFVTFFTQCKIMFSTCKKNSFDTISIDLNLKKRRIEMKDEKTMLNNFRWIIRMNGKEIFSFGHIG